MTLNPIDLVNAVLNLPVRIVDTVLNGYSINLWQVDVEGLLGFTGSLIALDQAIGAAISDLLSPTSPSPSLAPVNEPPQPSAMTLALTTSPAVNSGSKPEDAGLTMTGPDRSTQAQEGLDTAGTDNATNGLSQAQSNAVAQTQQGLESRLPVQPTPPTDSPRPYLTRPPRGSTDSTPRPRQSTTRARIFVTTRCSPARWVEIAHHPAATR